MTEALDRLQTRLGYRFVDIELLNDALRHRSAGSKHNERLEFLGDSLLNMATAEMLYRQYPTSAEGDLSSMRSLLVRQSALAAIARSLDLGQVIELGPSASQSGGHDRDSILSDAVEAILAAIYLDGGWDDCRHTTERLLASLDLDMDLSRARDAKSLLQEWLQSRGLPLPDYQTIEVSGPGHSRIYRVQCVLDSVGKRGEGVGNSRRTAEQEAAASVLALMEKSDG